MKKKVIIISLFVVGFALGFLAFYLSDGFGDDSSKILELTVDTNGGVPYKWEYEIEDESVVKYVKNYEINKEEEPVDGGHIQINYVFKGLKEGKTKVILKYINIVDKTVEKELVNNVKVDKNKNISLVGYYK